MQFAAEAVQGYGEPRVLGQFQGQGAGGGVHGDFAGHIVKLCLHTAGSGIVFQVLQSACEIEIPGGGVGIQLAQGAAVKPAFPAGGIQVYLIGGQPLDAYLGGGRVYLQFPASPVLGT